MSENIKNTAMGTCMRTCINVFLMYICFGFLGVM
jgi:hypothetical protein